MDTIQKLGKLEAIGFFITIIANFVIFNIPSIMLQTSGSSAWLNTIYIGIISFLIVLLVIKLFEKFPCKDIVDVAKFVGGNFFSNLIAIFYILFFIFLCSLNLAYFANGLKSIYFHFSPLPFILLFLLIPPLVANHYGLKVIAGVNRIFIPVITISILVLFFASSKDFTIQHFFPILGFGINETFGYGVTNIFAFTGLAYLYFFPPILKEHKDFNTVALLGTLFSFIFLLISVISLLLSCSAITKTDELFSIYLLTRIISFGTVFQRIDAIFILLWILAFFSFFSFNCFIILQLFKKTCKIKYENTMIYALIAIIFCISIIVKDITIIKFLFRNVFKYTFIFATIFLNITILIIANIKKKKNLED